MKKTLIVIAVLFLTSTSLNAQKLKGLAVYGGCNFAVGDYRDINIQDGTIVDWAMQTDSKLGGSGVGGNVGLEYSYPMPIKNLQLSASVDFFVNGLSKSLKSYYETLEVENSYRYDSYERNDQYFMNLPIMIGANYTIPTGWEPCNIMLEAACGINFRFITNYYEYWNTFERSYNSLEYHEYYDNAISFAYRFGASVVFINHLSFGVYFYGLGAATVKGDFSSEVYNVNDVPTNDDHKFLRGQLNPTMLVLRLGYHF